MGKGRKGSTGGGATMQLDAIVDDLEEIDAPRLGGAGLPPPLPPKKASRGVWIVGALVVVIATSLGLAVGFAFLTGSSEGEASAPAAPGPVGAAASPDSAAEPSIEGAAPAEDPEEEAEPNVVSLDEIVFDGTPEEALAAEGDEEDELPAQ